VVVGCRYKGRAIFALSQEVDEVECYGSRGHLVLAVYHLAFNFKQDLYNTIECFISQLISISYALMILSVDVQF